MGSEPPPNVPLTADKVDLMDLISEQVLVHKTHDGDIVNVPRSVPTTSTPMVGATPGKGYDTHAGMAPHPAGMDGTTGHAPLQQGTGYVHGDPRRHGDTTLPPPHPSNLDGRSYNTALNQPQAYMGTTGLYGSVSTL